IGQYVSSFVGVTFNPEAGKVEEAQRHLEYYFQESGTRFLPLLGVKGGAQGSASPWAQICQAKVAGSLVTKTTINNEILSLLPFLASKPSIQNLGGGAVVNTTALVAYPENPIDVATQMESPVEIGVKMKSREAIRKSLGVTLPGFPQATEVLKLDAEANITCKDLNQIAFQLALDNSTQEAQERYAQYGRPITFKDDLVYGTGIQWSSTGLIIEESDAGLLVQGVALVTPVSSFLFPGMHYCKVMSPYRAMEWINVDSLRAQKTVNQVEVFLNCLELIHRELGRHLLFKLLRTYTPHFLNCLERIQRTF
ncbi:hypothetical protein EGW08_019128, partial [Elysia chlorotica]